MTLLAGLISGPAAFAQYSSSNYKVEEAFFGAGGELDPSSTNYKAQQSIGELGVGNSASTNYQAYSGFNTTDRPILELAVNGGTFNFGVLDTSVVSALTTTFTVRNYLASGYIVNLVGTPPKNNSGGYALAGMSSPSASSPGTEQFGINLAANSLSGPGSFGAAPVQIPDGSFSFGAATGDYDTTNEFKYVEGNTIAQSTKSSGTTQYTLSMIANINTITPGGNYGTSLFVITTPTF